MTVFSNSQIRIALVGLVVCIAVGMINLLVIRLAGHNHWRGPSIFLVFVVFIVETALLGGIAGAKFKQQPIWFLFYGWAILFLNLALMLVNLNSHSYWLANQRAFVFAFFTAQIGLLIFWGVLGSSDWRRRIPIAATLLVTSGHPYWLYIGSDRDWLALMTGFIVSMAVSCLILRFFGFQLKSKDGWIPKNKTTRIDQFGTKHLFIWTGVVAVLFGIGRWVPWPTVADAIFDHSVMQLLMRAVLMTLIIVVTAWTVLGEFRGAWMRLIVLVIVLLAVAIVLFFIDQQNTWSKLAGWNATATEVMQVWLIWTVLNGLFLAGLMLVIRSAGLRLARVRKLEPESA